MNLSSGHRGCSLARKRGPAHTNKGFTAAAEPEESKSSRMKRAPTTVCSDQQGPAWLQNGVPGEQIHQSTRPARERVTAQGNISWRRHLNTDATQDTGSASRNTSLARKSAARQGKTNQETSSRKTKSRAKKSRRWTELHGRAGQEQQSQALMATQSRPSKTKQDGRNQSKKRKQPAANPKETFNEAAV
jgi:hypothetical protein